MTPPSGCAETLLTKLSNAGPPAPLSPAGLQMFGAEMVHEMPTPPHALTWGGVALHAPSTVRHALYVPKIR